MSCAETLSALNLAEGAETSAFLLADLGWGKNSRLPAAARLVAQYKGQSQQHLGPLKKAAEKLSKKSGDSKWHKLITDTIEIVEAAEKPKTKLKTIEEITR